MNVSILALDGFGVVGGVGVIHVVFVLGPLEAAGVGAELADGSDAAGREVGRTDAALDFDVAGRLGETLEDHDGLARQRGHPVIEPVERVARLIWLSEHALKVRDQRARQRRWREKVGSG